MSRQSEQTKPRARDLGLPLSGQPGTFNAITDVAGIAVGFKTLREASPRPGRKLPLCTGVTAIIPHATAPDPIPVYAGISRFNGNGEMTGSHWIEDGGYFLGPVLITNTHSVGIAHHAATRWMIRRYPHIYESGSDLWTMPVVAETYDGVLNDINGQHITEADCFEALDSASAGLISEGCVGGGTGMICYGFKGGTGTSSRRVDIGGQTYTIGVLVQANHGIREWLTVLGVPVGKHLPERGNTTASTERGSIIVTIATDLPALPHQLKRIARRAAIGIGRGGTPGGNSSGDIFLAFSTANARPMPHQVPPASHIIMINDDYFDPVYMAVVEGVEEAVLNAMLKAEDTGGGAHGGPLIEALRDSDLMRIMTHYNRAAPGHP